MLFTLITACSSTPEIPNKGANLDTLEAHANYISSKNTCKKMAEMNIQLLEKPFLLGAFDVRDGIAERVPAASYDDLFEALSKSTSPIVSTAPATSHAQSTDETIPEPPSGLRSTEERLSYVVAQAIAKGFGKNGIPVLPASMMIGLKDTQTKSAPKMSAAEEKAIVKMIKEKIQQADNDWAENRYRYYIHEEKMFLANNIIKPDVVSLDSGVQFIFLKKGDGKIPKANDSVTINYKGSLLDGTEFDSSYKRNKPDTFKLKALVPGFSQALLQVPTGSSLVIYIPAELAYGKKGTVGVPPYAALAFEVELLSIKK
ncbi:MAG: FKBP-type peptidyl-prolyl cis-trans isomerase [Pseudomonadota bacterium]